MDLSAQIALLETDTFTGIRIAGIFLVFGVALFAFTTLGKTFSLISLLISFFLFFILVANYFIQKYKYSQKGYSTKIMTDLIVSIMIAAILLNVWMIYTVWYSEENNLTQVAKDIQQQVLLANKVNAQIINANLQAIKENRELILQNSRALGIPTDNMVEKNLQNTLQTHETIHQSLNTSNKLTELNRTKGIRTDAILASLS